MLPTEQKPTSKLYILLELAIAIFFVLGYNLFEFIPIPETPFIVVLAFISLKLRKQKLKDLGFVKHGNWIKLISISLIMAILYQLSGYFTDPLLESLAGGKPDVSSFDEIRGNFTLLIVYFLLIWTLAAFGEEISYRGFILNKLAELMGSRKASWWSAIVFSSALFGLAHFYKGPAGMIDSGISGLIYGSLYYLSGRNLWYSIIYHGMVDTVGLFMVFFGIQLR